MKKGFLLFTAAAGMACISLSSYTSGPGVNLHANLTGSTGSAATCNTGGCHNNNSSTTTAAIQLLDATTNAVVTTYTPGVTYKVSITGSNSQSTALHYFGFQCSATFNTGTNMHKQAGTFTAGAYMHTYTVASSAITVVEHSTQLASTGGANNYAVQFTWTAPAAGNGSINFYAMLNAVNGDNGDGGDYPNAAPALTITENPVGIATLAANIGIKAYPNPVTNQLNLAIDGAQAGVYTVNVFDISGRKITTSNIQVNGNASDAVINTTGWAPGYYGVQVVKDGAQRLIPVVKQ